MERKKSRTMRHGEKRVGFTAAVLGGFLASLLLTGGLLLLLSLFLLWSEDPTRLLLPAGLGAAAVGAFLGGWRSGRLHRSAGALCGITHGMVLVFVFLMLALILEAGALELSSLFLYTALILLSTLGGALSSRRKRRRRL
ncbi:MAG: TIGR04086 family membrane protein [Clostridia bacterium]|nr:TIGR04086 family membrane protein [Clostridia bacterium]